ncbi:extracellular solute-binding protein [Rubellimicrobium aerolatum]|uniref:Extracellular solute-binding protein n=1 Tax=Rubellimicrobium aerolatum TaxID=490979 RepID=A0ABW0SFD9_9RHOB|nr:extracellular solute-binding protein [Rubellimicrobium aerolatum]MBP1806513.1 microcin C transport system substrate-binding protein [Rubellimicrobium aerolatum]
MTGPRRRATAIALAAERGGGDLRWIGLGGLALAALLALPARGQEAAAVPASAEGGTTVSHGYNYFGDLKYPADFAHLDYVNPDAPKGGEISEWNQGNFDSFNPFTIQGTATPLGAFPFESLMTSTADEPASLYCLICSTLEYPADLSWVEFEMRPEAAFSDGTPLTAQDVKFSFDLFMEQGLESFRMAWGPIIESVEVLGDHRLRFEFSAESPSRDRIPLAGGLTILSRAEFERTGARLDESSNVPFLGSGPYTIDSWDMGRRVVLRRDEDYWGRDLPISVGRNNFDTIRFEYFADSTVALEAFKAGEYTFRVESDALLWATAYDFPALDAGQVVREEIPSGLVPVAAYWAFNLRREVFQDPRVREALILLFNFEWTNETLLYGYYEQVPSFFANTDMMAEGLPTEGELAILQPLVDEGLLDESLVTSEAVLPPPSSAERDIDRGNLREASRLLDEAGWTVGEDGVRRNAEGEPLVVEFLEFSPSFQRLTLPFIENLRRVGVDARFELVDPAQFTQRRDSSDFDISRWSPAFDFEPGTSVIQWFGSASAAESNRNLPGVQDPAVDRIATLVAQARTREEMEAAARALDRVLRSMRLGVPRWYNPNSWVAYYDMYEHPEPLPPFAVGELDFWWYDDAKGEALRAAGAFQ